MLVKKAGMVVLGAAAGVAALSGTAFAGEAQASTGHGHSWDRGHDHHHGDRDNDRDRDIRFNDNDVRFSDDDFSPSASNEQGFFGDQTGLVNLGNTNVQAPISAVVDILGGVTA
ncbi:hypothetical protein WCD74_06730 [Actinomycetospora sp. OC33-EN08]|uniref:Uncharacterized protein n=1 Tax=Actinomycetospora aurantiaca TaxID=3129233 RepID=A0ABU8MJG5_9PSEU